MKKSTLLSLATAGAIVATSVGTFAAWDQMSAVSSESITLNYGTPVSTTVASVALNDSNAILAPSGSLEGSDEVIGTVKVTVNGPDAVASKALKLTAVSDANGETPLLNDNITIEFSEDGTTFNSGDQLAISKGTEKTYNVKIKLNDNLSEKPNDLPSNFYVKAEVVDKASA